jgi:hypothetical protein
MSQSVNLTSPVFRHSFLPNGTETVSLVASPATLTFNTSRSPAVTAKRVKPSDLFAAGTAISGYTEIYTSSQGVDRVKGSADYYSGNCAYWGGNLAATAQSLPALTFNGVDGRLRAKIKDSNLNLAQSLAEYRSTCGMFTSLATDIYKTFRSLRSGGALSGLVRALRNPRSALDKQLANRWLEYQYGWKPLMSDIYGGLEELSKSLETGVYRFQKTSESMTFRSTASGVKSYSQEPYICYRTTNVSQRARARYRIKYAGLKQLSQIGITNPALLAWELIPYSFVIDWVFPVGDFLSSLDALNGIENLVVIHERRVYHDNNAAGVRYQRDSRDRFLPTSSLLLPRLGYKPSTSLTAVLNGVALLRQLR